MSVCPSVIRPSVYRFQVISFVSINGFWCNFVCTLILWRSVFGLLLRNFVTFDRIICPRNYNGGILSIHVFIFSCVESHSDSVPRDSNQGLCIPLEPSCVATCTAVWFGGDVPTTTGNVRLHSPVDGSAVPTCRPHSTGLRSPQDKDQQSTASETG